MQQKNFATIVETYNKTNFFKHTFCIFEEVDVSQIQNLKCNYSSKSKSQYFFNAVGVYRVSNHWGRASNCRWRLASKNKSISQKTLVGFAKWTDFFVNDETSNLYFVTVDFNTSTVNFNHKNAPEFDGKAQLRSAQQTAKVIQNIKLILKDASWAKHLKFENYTKLQTDSINQLIYTNQTLSEIKRMYL